MSVAPIDEAEVEPCVVPKADEKLASTAALAAEPDV